MKNKNVTSWYVKKHESGIYSLIFNTVDRWIYFHRYNNNEYIFGDEDSEIEIIPDFLPKDISYLPTVIQEKDQIIFYFIPIKQMLHPLNSENILTSKI